jgi:2,4-dienoyl-CoA reductase-like NADH-dependent reductase (Old Yellow Enzyme family)
MGAVAGIQIGHAGRKASVRRPWEGGAAVAPAAGGWQTVAPSPLPFRPTDPAPAELTKQDIRTITESFVAATHRALAAGFQLVELHGAHGYLVHQFLSPLSNHRTDEYGGSFENRIRFALETVEAVRAVWPAELPLWLRISATDWVEGGWTIEESIELTLRVKAMGVDLIDCSSGGSSMAQQIPLAAGYQTPFAARIRAEAGIATGAVGLITTAEQANEIVSSGKADVVLLAREFLRDPYFPLHAARTLGAEFPPPDQYLRAF